MSQAYYTNTNDNYERSFMKNRSVTTNGSGQKVFTLNISDWSNGSEVIPSSSNVEMYWTTNGGSTWQHANMTNVGGDAFQYTFPAYAAGTVVHYIVAARRSTSEQWSLYPVGHYSTGTADPMSPSISWNNFTISY